MMFGSYAHSYTQSYPQVAHKKHAQKMISNLANHLM